MTAPAAGPIRRHLEPAEIAGMVDKHGQGWTIKEIAEYYSHGYGAVREALIKAGVTLRPRSYRRLR